MIKRTLEEINEIRDLPCTQGRYFDGTGYCTLGKLYRLFGFDFSQSMVHLTEEKLMSIEEAVWETAGEFYKKYGKTSVHVNDTETNKTNEIFKELVDISQKLNLLEIIPAPELVEAS